MYLYVLSEIELQNLSPIEVQVDNEQSEESSTQDDDTESKGSCKVTKGFQTPIDKSWTRIITREWCILIKCLYLQSQQMIFYTNETIKWILLFSMIYGNLNKT